MPSLGYLVHVITRRRMTVMLLVALVAGSALLAAGAGLAEPTTSSAPPLTLARAKELCRASSPLIGMALAKIDMVTLDEQQAAETAEAIAEDQVASYEIAQIKYLQPAKATSDRLLAEAALAALEINLDLQVTNAFVGGLSAERFLALAQNAAGRAEDQVALANKLYQAGMAAYKDVLDAEAKRAEVLAGVVSARKGLELSRIGIARLTGLAPGDLPSLDPAGASSAAPAIDLAEAIAAATRDRYEAVQAREYVALAQLNLELAQTYPSGGYSSLLPEDLPEGIELPPEFYEEPSWERSNVYTIPEADAQLRSALYGQQAQLEELEFQVRSAMLDLDAARQMSVLYEPAVVAAREGLRLAELRYEAGMAINLEVLAAGLNLANAEANYQNAIYQEITAAAKLAHAASRGSQSIYPGAGQAQ